MIPDLQILLIAVVFASQIFVLSVYAPIRWQRYHARLFEKYPREEYPRLHPLPREELDRKFALFRPLHLIIGAGAAFVLLVVFVYADNAQSLAGPMVMCLLAQVMLPLFIALPLEIRILKGLSSMPPPNQRSVELRKWRVTDFISPMWVGLGLAMQALSIACAVAMFVYRPGTLGIFPSLIGGTVILLAMGHALFGHRFIATRADPFMSQADTFHVRQRNYRGLFVLGAVFGAWGTLTLLYNAGFLQFDIAFWFVISSAISQLFGLALVSGLNRDLNTRDFSVYRADGSAQVAR